MNTMTTYNYYTLADILGVCLLPPETVTLTKLLEKTTTINRFKLIDTEKSEYFFENYLMPRTLYDYYIITPHTLKLIDDRILNQECRTFFDKLVSKINAFFSTYADLITKYDDTTDNLLKNGEVTNTSKSNINDTPNNTQSDKYNDIYASETSKTISIIQDDSGILIDKLDNLKNKKEDFYELLYKDVEKMIAGDIYEI